MRRLDTSTSEKLFFTPIVDFSHSRVIVRIGAEMILRSGCHEQILGPVSYQKITGT
jgi:hypothetical protein